MNKANNSDLLKLKIKIACKNDIAYVDCASFLDKPEFLRKLPDLRKEFEINSLIPYKDFFKWKEERIMEDLREHKTKDEFMKAAKTVIKKRKDGATSEELFNLMRFTRRFEWRSEFLCREFEKPGYFSLIIQYAIVCGEVGDKSYRHTYIDVIPHDLHPSDDIPLPNAVIVISPMTTMKDIKEVFKANLPKIFEENKELLSYFSRMKKDDAPFFKRDREWYWRNLAGEGYTKIALSITTSTVKELYRKRRKRDEIPEYNSVKTQIRRYKQLLKVYI